MVENALNDILKTEFSEEFVSLMKNRMVVSFYKYGPVAGNYGVPNVNAVENLQKRVKKYIETGNTEWLVDAANFAMIEFMYPQHEKAHFRATDSKESPGVGGVTVREVEKWKNGG